MPEFKVARRGESEAEFRQFLAYLFSGPGVLSGLAVAQTTTASASVTVGAGLANVVRSTLAGSEPLINNAAKTLDVLTANPLGGVPRNDIVVFDADTSTIRAIIGTPNATPTDPTVPASAVRLARLRHVTANAGTIPSSAIDDLRPWARVGGGPFASCAGSYTHTATIVPNSIAGPFPQTFPAGRFTVAPSVTFGITEGSRLTAYATSVTKDGFNLYLRNVSASDSPGGVDIANWQAVQMTPTTANG